MDIKEPEKQSKVEDVSDHINQDLSNTEYYRTEKLEDSFQSQRTENREECEKIEEKTNIRGDKAVASMVLGILSVLFMLPLLGIILAIIGLVLSVQVRKDLENTPTGSYYGMATAGLVCSIVGLTLSSIVTVFIGFLIFVQMYV